MNKILIISMVKRLLLKIQSSLRLAALGDGFCSTLEILALLYWIPVRRRLGFSNVPLVLRLTKAARSFQVHLDGSHEEFLILDEILARDEYKVPVESPETVFDVGGNIGLAALYFAVTYPTAQIHTFEPNPKMYERLLQNVRQLPNITAHNVALTGVDGPVVFYSNNEKPIASSLVCRGEGFVAETVKGLSLRSAMQCAGVFSINILKFDVEGAEYEMLRAFDGLDRVGYVIGEVHEDLMDVTIDEFLEQLRPFFTLNIAPGGKKSRYIVKGCSRNVVV